MQNLNLISTSFFDFQPKYEYKDFWLNFEQFEKFYRAYNID